ncbi:MAG: YncE family protein, partial [Limisphaerales bacterium]
MHKNIFPILATTLVLAGLSRPGSAAQNPYLHAPSVDTYAAHDPEGVTILSNGRLLTPAGKPVPVAREPCGLAMTRDGAILFVASDGVGQIVTDWQSGQPKVTKLMPIPPKRRRERDNTGAADFSPDGKTLYWSGGESGAVMIFDVASGTRQGEVELNTELGTRTYEGSYIMDLKVSQDGRFLYCADVANFRIVVVDLETRGVVGSVPVGRYPYALAVTGSHVYAANIGLFEYSPVGPPGTNAFDNRGLTRPPFGYPSKEARNGVEFEGRKIPGLGEPNVPESFSVWGVDVTHPENPAVISRLKTGLLLGAPADNGKTVGGSAPNYVCARGDTLFISNGNNDLIERVDLKSNRITARARLSPSPLVAGLRGVGPAGMALSPDGAKLFVAEMSINAIAVLDTKTMQILGHIPTAWYPYRVAISPDGRKLACICFRGFGNGPNAGQFVPKSEFLHMRGVLSLIDVPSPAELDKLTAQVLRNNGLEDRESDRVAMSSP